jgi:type II secretory pathway pseudopilin PulG
MGRKTEHEKNNKNFPRDIFGFTLIELLVIISIIGLLSSAAVFALNNARNKARDAKRMGDLKQIQTALDLYYNEKGYYPEYTNLGVRCNVSAANSLSGLVSENLMVAVPTDPKNTSSPNPRHCYEYVSGGASVSSWYCSGRPRTDYAWSLLFSTESISFNFPRLTDSGGVPNNEYAYCLYGPLK